VRRISAIAGALAVAIACLGTASAASAARGSVRPGLPIIRDQGAGQAPTGAPTISLNWSGYVVQSPSKFKDVSSTFVQPAVTCNGVSPEATSNWVGLDGYTNGTVEQTGTIANCKGANDKTPVYKAWYEMFPAGSVNVFTVKPGDLMSVAVRYKNGKFHLKIADLTSGKSFKHSATCNSCQRSSAEWIIERPAFCTNASCTHAVIGALPDFVTTKMNNAVATAGSVSGSISAFKNTPIEGVYNLSGSVNPGTDGFISVDTTGPLATSPSRFTMTWNRSGGTIPITL